MVFLITIIVIIIVIMGEKKMGIILQTTFSNAFSWAKILVIVPKGSIVYKSALNQVMIWHWTITWTNDDPDCWYICNTRLDLIRYAFKWHWMQQLKQVVTIPTYFF